MTTKLAHLFGFLMIYCDYLSWIVILSHSSGVRFSVCGEELTDTLDEGCGTESNCVCMYTVQSRVIADNKCEFQHTPLLTVIPTLMQDS